MIVSRAIKCHKMADGGDKIETTVNNLPSHLIGQGDNIANDISQYTHVQFNESNCTVPLDVHTLDCENDSLHLNEFDVGGVKCKEEDKGYFNSSKIDKRTSDTQRFVPKLTFLDSDESLTNSENFNPCESDKVTRTSTHECRDRRSVSDSAVLNNRGSFAEKSHVNEIDGSYTLLTDNTDVLLQSQNSHVSIQSSDSDLITDLMIMHAEQDQLNAEEEKFEQCLFESSDIGKHFDDWHCHAGTVKIPPDKVARNQLIAVSVLCFVFMIGEAIGGALSNSLALFTDVLHLGSDLVSFLISLLSMYLAKKHATKTMSFGYHRAEVLGALFSVFIIWSVTGVLVYVAIERIVQEHYKEVKPDEMLITAVLGVVFNIIMGFVLHSELCCGKSGSKPNFGHGHSHSHGHSHGANHQNDNGYQRSLDNRHSRKNWRDKEDYQPLLRDEEDLQMAEEGAVGNPEFSPVDNSNKTHPKNINVRAAFIHVLGDIIQSMGVLLASIIIKIKPEEKYRLADPICTFLFSILVLFTTVNVLKDTLRIIMEGVPRDVNYYSIKQSLQKLHGVKAVHGLSVWCLTLEKNALAVHLAVDKTVNYQQVLYEAAQVLKDRYKLLHTTIQVEEYKSDIMARCQSCQELKK